MRIAITGSNGFIGNELVNYFLANGHEVLLLQRKAPEVLPAHTSYQTFDLNDLRILPDLDNVDVLIHAAYMLYTATNGATEKNIEGTMVLYKLCLNRGVHFVFLSSMSGHANSLSQYGKHKFELEQQLAVSKCLVIKPGLVLGKKGLFSRIYNAFKKMPVSILMGGGKQPIQTVYIDDLVRVIAQCAVAKRTGIYMVATSTVYSMKELFTAIAVKAGKKPFFISVPYWTVSLGIGLIELLHLPFPVSKENVLGLKQQQAADTAADLKRLGVTLLDLKESLDLL